MKTYRFLIVLTLINLALVLTTFWRTWRVEAQNDTVLRGRALEIVDSQGRVRATIGVIPADGDQYPETVLLRLIDENGRPNVKLQTTMQGAGIGLGGDDDPTYAVLKAEGSNTSLKLTNKDGREQLVRP